MFDGSTTPLPDPHVLAFPETTLERIKYGLLLPIEVLLYITVPNAKKQPGLWPLAFVNSIAWIGAVQFLIVWWAHVTALAFQIPESVLGMTIIAIGASIPDIATEINVTREGHGDMAMSGSFGSNIMNVGLGLGLPWFITSVAGYNFEVNTILFFIAAISLIVLLVFIITFIAGFKWMLGRALGGVMFFFYLVYLFMFLLLALT
jgi:Ca2+/Na+ antiporter